MSTRNRLILTCTCERTMPVDERALDKAGCGKLAGTVDQLCRGQLDLLRETLLAGDAGHHRLHAGAGAVRRSRRGPRSPGSVFANIRETGGWSERPQRRARRPPPDAAAAVDDAPARIVSMQSAGVALILGSDETRSRPRAPRRHLDVTVMLSRPKDVAPPRRTAFPVVKGTVAKASGVLGKFRARHRRLRPALALLAIDAGLRPLPRRSRLRLRHRPRPHRRATALPRPRAAPRLSPRRSGRQGGRRARHIRGDAARRGPSTSRATSSSMRGSAPIRARPSSGCTRCLDLCPAGAIEPAGDSVAIDPEICAGCGQCAAACPTGAASYMLPPVEAVANRLRVLLRSCHEAGGRDAPVVLFHDGEHGEELIDALARFGDGLPAERAPRRSQRDHPGRPGNARRALRLRRIRRRASSGARSRSTISLGLSRTLDTTATILTALGYGEAAVGLIETDDPDILRAELLNAVAATSGRGAREPAGFLPVPSKRGLLELGVPRDAPRRADPGRCDPARRWRSVRRESMSRSRAARSASPASPPAPSMR
jgi:ferredoxin